MAVKSSGGCPIFVGNRAKVQKTIHMLRASERERWREREREREIIGEIKKRFAQACSPGMVLKFIFFSFFSLSHLYIGALSMPF